MTSLMTKDKHVLDAADAFCFLTVSQVIHVFDHNMRLVN